MRTIAVLEPINTRIEEMTNDERSSFRLKPDFGGSSKSIYHRTIKKVYGRDPGVEVINALQDCPVVAVPVVLARLKQKDEEWRRAQREWSRTWREVDTKNFYKSLDHQGISFKANDKKNITAKHFVADIEAIKKGQLSDPDESANSLSYAHGSGGHQLDLGFQDTSVLNDALKMAYSFLDHSQAIYGPQERRSLEKFIRSFMPILFMFSPVEFNAACGPDGTQDDDIVADNDIDGQRNGRRSVVPSQASGGNVAGVPASDLRKKLLKTVQEKANKRDGDSSSRVASRASSPTPRNGSPSRSEAVSGAAPAKEKAEDVWIREVVGLASAGGQGSISHKPERKPFFANTTFYTLLRLLHVSTL
jgi:paired amphipathic helix protein Sin3a